MTTASCDSVIWDERKKKLKENNFKYAGDRYVHTPSGKVFWIDELKEMDCYSFEAFLHSRCIYEPIAPTWKNVKKAEEIIDFWKSNNEPHKSIGLCESEVNVIINGMYLILSSQKDSLSENAKIWYTHIKNLFESFKESNY